MSSLVWKCFTCMEYVIFCFEVCRLLSGSMSLVGSMSYPVWKYVTCRKHVIYSLGVCHLLSGSMPLVGSMLWVYGRMDMMFHIVSLGKLSYFISFIRHAAPLWIADCSAKNNCICSICGIYCLSKGIFIIFIDYIELILLFV